jgi:hypothetical protein
LLRKVAGKGSFATTAVAVYGDVDALHALQNCPK